MRKIEFIAALYEKLALLLPNEAEERVAFYAEMIDERMEEGLSEEEAVSQLGSVDEIVSQILADIPLSSLIREKVRPKRPVRAWEIVLLVLGFPLWFPLLLAAFAVLFSVYIAIWSVVISLWAVDISLMLSALGCIIAGVFLAAQGNVLVGMAAMGVGLICGGLAIFGFFICKLVSRAVVFLTGKMLLGIKWMFVGKEKRV